MAQYQSDERKKRKIKRHNKWVPSLITLQSEDRVLVRNLSESRGTGKLKNQWKEKVHTSNIQDSPRECKKP